MSKQMIPQYGFERNGFAKMWSFVATFAVVSFIIVRQIFIACFYNSTKCHMAVNMSLHLFSNRMLCHY